MNMTVGERIKSVRVSKDISQEELAFRMGYSGKSSISKLENSGNKIDLDTIEKVAKALRCDVAELLDRDPDEPQNKRIRVTKRLTRQQYNLIEPPEMGTAVVTVDAMPKVGETRKVVSVMPADAKRIVSSYKPSKREKIIKMVYDLDNESLDELENYITFLLSKGR